jgi:hypothetical protein
MTTRPHHDWTVCEEGIHGLIDRVCQRCGTGKKSGTLNEWRMDQNGGWKEWAGGCSYYGVGGHAGHDIGPPSRIASYGAWSLMAKYRWMCRACKASFLSLGPTRDPVLHVDPGLEKETCEERQVRMVMTA